MPWEGSGSEKIWIPDRLCTSEIKNKIKIREDTKTRTS